jgi:energy-converting hydrogenase Eha subunit C
MNQDEEHLRLLSIFHYIVGGITALCACFPLIHLVIGLALVFAPETPSSPEHSTGPDRLVGLFFTLFAVAFIILGWAFAIATAYTGRCLARREHYTFCLVVAAVNCLNTPIGTILGVFTIVVLMRPSVKERFAANQPAPSATDGTWSSST